MLLLVAHGAQTILHPMNMRLSDIVVDASMLYTPSLVLLLVFLVLAFPAVQDQQYFPYNKKVVLVLWSSEK